MGIIESTGMINHVGSVKKCRIVKFWAFVAFRKLQEVSAIQVAQSAVKRKIRAPQPGIRGGA